MSELVRKATGQIAEEVREAARESRLTPKHIPTSMATTSSPMPKQERETMKSESERSPAQAQSDELDAAVLQLYQKLRGYLPDMPDLKDYSNLIVSPDVSVTFGANQLPQVSLTLVLVPGADRRGVPGVGKMKLPGATEWSSLGHNEAGNPVQARKI